MNFEVKAKGFLINKYSMAFCLIYAHYSILLQSQQLHSSVHMYPAAKHSQYNFKHFDFLQLHGCLFSGLLLEFPLLDLNLRSPVIILFISTSLCVWWCLLNFF